jgi:hypothetical protein
MRGGQPAALVLTDGGDSECADGCAATEMCDATGTRCGRAVGGDDACTSEGRPQEAEEPQPQD